MLSEQEKLLKQLQALRDSEQRVSVESAPKKLFEVDHTNASANSSGDGSGWTEVSVTPHVMEMKQVSDFDMTLVIIVPRCLFYYFNAAAQADIAAKSIRRFLRNLDTGTCCMLAMACRLFAS